MEIKASHLRSDSFRLDINQTSILIFCLDHSNDFLFFNNSFKHQLGYSSCEMEKRSIWDFIPAEEVSYLQKTINAIREGICDKEVSIPFLHKNNHIIFCEGSFLKTTENLNQATTLTGVFKQNEKLNLSGISFWQYDPTTKRFNFDDNYCALLAFNKVELGNDLNNAFLRLIHPSDRVKGCEFFEQLLSEKLTSPARTLIRMKTKANNWLKIVMLGDLIKKASKMPVIEGISIDVSDWDFDRKKNDEMFLKMILEHTNDYIYFKNKQGYIEFCSQAMAEALGYQNQKALVGEKLADIFPYPLAETYQNEEEEALKNQQDIFDKIDPFFGNDDFNSWVLTNKKVITEQEDVRGILAVSKDITAYKAAEIKLKHNWEFYQKIIFRSGIVVWETDLNGLFTYVSDSVKEVYGYNAAELISRVHCYELHTLDNQKEFKKSIFASLKEDYKLISVESVVRRKSGEQLAVLTQIRPLLANNGELMGFWGLDRDISAFKCIEKKYFDQYHFLNEFLLNLPLPAIVFAAFPSGKLLLSNQEFTRSFGYQQEDIANFEKFALKLTSSEEFIKKVEHCYFPKAEAIGERVSFQTAGMQFHGKNGEVYDIIINCTINENKIAIVFQSLLINNQQQQDLTMTSLKLFEDIPVGMYVLRIKPDKKPYFSFVNKKLIQMIGIEQETAFEKSEAIFNSMHPVDYQKLRNICTVSQEKRVPFTIEGRFKVDNQLKWFSTEAIPRTLSDGELIWEGIFTDITSRKMQEELLKKKNKELLKQAKYDCLTGLPNRFFFVEAFEKALMQAEQRQNKMAILMLDLDSFKFVNDSYGHAVGDEVLIQAAAKIKNSLRRYDIVARYGGDEFIVLLTEIVDQNDACNVGQKILHNFKQPFYINDVEIYLTVSIGISVFPDQGNSLIDLLQKSDQALYRIKYNGKNNIGLIN